jgi:hypothetical protein
VAAEDGDGAGFRCIRWRAEKKSARDSIIGEIGSASYAGWTVLAKGMAPPIPRSVQ